VDPLGAVVGTRLGSVLYLAGDDGRSEGEFLQVLSRDSENWPAHAELALVYADDHRCPQAMKERSLIPATVTGDANIAGFLGLATALCHRPHLAEQYLRTGVYPNGFSLATIYAALGDKDKIIQSLGKALNEHAWGLFYLRVHPAFKSYRSEEWFKDLLHTLKLDG
jgi:hypothetical protein